MVTYIKGHTDQALERYKGNLAAFLTSHFQPERLRGDAILNNESESEGHTGTGDIQVKIVSIEISKVLNIECPSPGKADIDTNAI